MASRSFIIFISSLLLISLSFPSATASDYSPETPEQPEKVVVEGVVYCQSCDRYGTSSLAGAEPIPSAKISVICKNHKGQVSFYKSFVADVKGYFYAQLEGFKVGQHLLDHPLHGCKVKLVSSPLAKCSELTNVNNGLYGAPLRYCGGGTMRLLCMLQGLWLSVLLIALLLTLDLERRVFAD